MTAAEQFAQEVMDEQGYVVVWREHGAYAPSEVIDEISVGHLGDINSKVRVIELASRADYIHQCKRIGATPDEDAGPHFAKVIAE